MVFHWSLIDRKSPQISRTLHSILAELDVFWMVSTCSLISKFSSPFTNHLEIFPIIIIIIIAIFHVSVDFGSFTAWLQVSSDIQGSSQYSGRSQQYCSVLQFPTHSRSLSKPLGTVPNVPITTDITISLIFHNFLCFLSTCLSLLFLWFSLYRLFVTSQSPSLSYISEIINFFFFFHHRLIFFIFLRYNFLLLLLLLLLLLPLLLLLLPFGLVSFFLVGISIFVGYVISKPPL